MLLEKKPDFKSKGFQDAFGALREKDIEGGRDIEALINIYTEAKDLYIRNACLKLLYNQNKHPLKDFFEKAYKKEPYLDMKANALRGLLNYAPEAEIEELLENFNAMLEERKKTTPYNYQEYEMLLGKNSLPFLHRKYGYKCLKKTLEIVQKQYDELPEALKGHFTVDENGNMVLLRTPEETGKMITEFFDKINEKYYKGG